MKIKTKFLIALFPLTFVPSKAISVPSSASGCNPQKKNSQQAIAELDTIRERYNSAVSNYKDSLNNLPANSLYKVTKFQNQDKRRIHFIGTRAELNFMRRTEQLDQAFENLKQAEDKKTKAMKNYRKCLDIAEQQPADASP